MSADLEFLARLGSAWEGATEGFCLQVYQGGKKRIDVEVGKTYRYYDWASLTKVVFSTTAWMMLFDEKRFKLTDRVDRHVPWFPEESPAKIKTLFSHAAGLTWWYPFFKTVAPKTEGLAPVEAWSVFEKRLAQRIRADFKKKPVTDLKSTPAVYSDLDLFVLGSALQNLTGRSLLENWNTVCDRIGFDKVGFSVDNQPRFKKTMYAPTETCSWRGRTLQGEVHDENAWSLRGVAPHAGLFGSIDELSRWALLLRQAKRGVSTGGRFASSATTEIFTKRSIPVSRGDWALGFMMPTRGSASSGRYMSPQTIGHTGFTGTSVWLDPRRDVLIVLLSNRVHPTRENRAFVALRPQIHDWVNEILGS